MGCSVKRGSPARPNEQRDATGSTSVTRPVWTREGPQNLRNSAFFAFRKGFYTCSDRDVGHESANTPKMNTKPCVLRHVQHIFTTPGFSPVSTISSVAAFGFKVIVAALASGHYPAVVDIRGTKNVTLLMLGVCAYVRLAAPFDLGSPCASCLSNLQYRCRFHGSSCRGPSSTAPWFVFHCRESWRLQFTCASRQAIVGRCRRAPPELWRPSVARLRQVFIADWPRYLLALPRTTQCSFTISSGPGFRGR